MTSEGFGDAGNHQSTAGPLGNAWQAGPADQRIGGKISGGMLQLAMVEYSLRLDRVLMDAFRRMRGAPDASIADLGRRHASPAMTR